jgi:hypothetical protein
VIKELFNGRAKTRTRPEVTKATAKLTEVPDEDRRIDGTAKRTTDKSRRGLRRYIDGLIHRRDFCDRDAMVNCF